MSVLLSLLSSPRFEIKSVFPGCTRVLVAGLNRLSSSISLPRCLSPSMRRSLCGFLARLGALLALLSVCRGGGNRVVETVPPGSRLFVEWIWEDVSPPTQQTRPAGASALIQFWLRLDESMESVDTPVIGNTKASVFTLIVQNRSSLVFQYGSDVFSSGPLPSHLDWSTGEWRELAVELTDGGMDLAVYISGSRVLAERATSEVPLTAGILIFPQPKAGQVAGIGAIDDLLVLRNLTGDVIWNFTDVRPRLPSPIADVYFEHTFDDAHVPSTSNPWATIIASRSDGKGAIGLTIMNVAGARIIEENPRCFDCTSGLCSNSTGFECKCSHCNVNGSRCDASTNYECQCFDNSINGHWTNANCSACASSDTLGHWTGSRCNSCAPGYALGLACKPPGTCYEASQHVHFRSCRSIEGVLTFG